MSADNIVLKERYIAWQAMMLRSNWYRRWLVFWALYSIFLLIPMALLLLTRDGRAQLLLCVAAFGLSRGVLSNIVTRFYHRERPYQRYGFEPPSSAWFSWLSEKPNSFPSKHVASLASIAVMLLFFYPTVGIFGLLISIMAGWSRVILGYHYLSDVMAGLILGVIGALIVYYFGAPLLFTRLG